MRTIVYCRNWIGITVLAISVGCVWRRQGRSDFWQPIAVHEASKLTQGAVDSGITIRVANGNRIIVLFAFDNACHFPVTARTRSVGDTIDVAFDLVIPKTMTIGNDTLPFLPTCPAAIMNRGYEVKVGNSNHDVHVVRGIDVDKVIRIQRIVPEL